MANASDARGSAREQIDYVVSGCVVPMREPWEVIADGAVAICGGTIAAIGPREDILAHYAARHMLGGPRSIVFPGMIDCHTHCTACFARSLTAGELPMIPRLYNPGQRCHPPEEAKTAVRLVAAQLLRSGVTTVCEGSLIPEQEEAILEALEEVGIRCCFARGFTDQEFHHAALYSQVRDKSWILKQEGAAEADLEITDRLLRRYPPHGRQLIRGAVSASSLTGFSATYFKGAADLARQHDTSLQVHADRDREEVEFCLSLWGCRPIERLAELGVVNDRLVAIHGVLATRREIDILGGAAAALVHAPIEAVCNGNAIPDIQSFRRSGVQVGLGCDNQVNDMFETMRATWLIHGAMWGIPTYAPEYLSAEEILAMATIQAARVLKLDDIVGSLEPGKAADLVVLDADSPHLMGIQDVITEIVRWATRAEVTDVMVDGRLLLSERRLTSIDLKALWPQVDTAASRARRVIGPRRYRPTAGTVPWPI